MPPTTPSPLARDAHPLAGRTVLVTGVSRRAGIGHAIACRAAALGAGVVAHHYSPHDAAQAWGADDVDAVMASIATHLSASARLTPLHADLASPGEPARVVDLARDAARAAGQPLTALVCNQAMSEPDAPLLEVTADVLDRHWAVDARASLLLAQAFARVVVADRAGAGDRAATDTGAGAPGAVEAANGDGARHAIVMLTSGQGHGPLPGEVAYGTAKAALAGITLTLADELADHAIRVNTVNPGPVDTGYLGPGDWEAVRSKFPFGRFGQPDDAARLITWLLTDEARWVTGQVISSEGGFARWRP